MIANQQLVIYIQQCLKRGYNINYIRSYLINYGYKQEVVDSAIRAIYQQYQQQYQQPQQAIQQQAIQQPTTQVQEVKEVRHIIHIPLGAILAILLIISLIGAGIYFVPQLFPKQLPETLLDLSLEPLSMSIEPGDDLVFLKEIFNLGAEKRYDIILRHKVISAKTKEAIISQSETVAIETRGSTKTTIRLPDDIELGKYVLETTAVYGQQTAKASFSFKVYRPSDTPTCNDNIQNQGEEGIDCGSPCPEKCTTCFDRIQNGDETGIDCGGSCKLCAEPSCFDNIQNQDEEGIDCGGSCPVECRKGTCTDGELSPGEEGIDCGGVCPRQCTTRPGGPSPIEGLSTREVIEKAKKVAEINQDDAIMLCRQLEKLRDQDSCISEIALVTGNSNYCGLIESDAARDSCYMGFAMNNDFSVCSKITKPVLRQSCNGLAQTNLMEELVRQNRTGELYDKLGIVVNETPGIELGGNQPPIINPIGTISATVGQRMFMQIGASDADAFDPLTFSDNTDLFEINPVSGIIDFMPTAADIGTHNIIIEVTDGELSDSEEMVLEIVAG